MPIIAWVRYGFSKKPEQEGNHFVVIVGKTSDNKFIMNDPGYKDGNGVANSTSENIIGETKRKGGYTIVRIDLIEKEGEW